MARTKRIPIQCKYPKTIFYRYTNDKIDRGHTDRTHNYVSPLARRRATYEAKKAKWEAQNPDIPYPDSPPIVGNRRGAAGRK
jgi:hypothetical protein